MARLFQLLLLCIFCLAGGRHSHAATTIATELGKGSALGFDYALLKLSDGAAAPSFAQYFPPTAGPPGPVLIYILPYNGLTWSDQAIDKIWASRTHAGAGYSYPDVAQANYVAGFSGPILYWITPPDQLAGLAHPYLANGIGVLFLHERFYTGESIDAQRRNIRLVYDFLAGDPRVD
ncbi:MAG: hypothetical protein JO255_15575, partial [Alphaproteobacteria bacterium]|nr:hypothetical protein [Alphaproteobacteria bacterium]